MAVDQDKERRSKLTLMSNAALALVLAFPFLDTIDWRDGYGWSASSRSLVMHAYWWVEEATFGPFWLPAIALAVPIVLTVLSAAWRGAMAARVRWAAAAAITAWAAVGAAVLEAGEDIVFTWYRMRVPLAIEAGLISAFLVTMILRARAAPRPAPPTEF